MNRSFHALSSLMLIFAIIGLLGALIIPHVRHGASAIGSCDNGLLMVVKDGVRQFATDGAGNLMSC